MRINRRTTNREIHLMKERETSKCEHIRRSKVMTLYHGIVVNTIVSEGECEYL